MVPTIEMRTLIINLSVTADLAAFLTSHVSTAYQAQKGQKIDIMKKQRCILIYQSL